VRPSPERACVWLHLSNVGFRVDGLRREVRNSCPTGVSRYRLSHCWHQTNKARAFNWPVYSEVTMRQEKDNKLAWDKQGFMLFVYPNETFQSHWSKKSFFLHTSSWTFWKTTSDQQRAIQKAIKYVYIVDWKSEFCLYFGLLRFRDRSVQQIEAIFNFNAKNLRCYFFVADQNVEIQIIDTRVYKDITS
jgi:hypothetical protein